MHDLPKTLDQICALLGTAPGVGILGSSLEEASARIDFTVSEKATILALQDVTMGANVSLQPWLRRAALEGIGPQPVKQTIVASTVRRDTFKFGELQMLGIHLVWYLHKVGALATGPANMQLHYWGGCRVGA